MCEEQELLCCQKAVVCLGRKVVQRRSAGKGNRSYRVTTQQQTKANALPTMLGERENEGLACMAWHAKEREETACFKAMQAEHPRPKRRLFQCQYERPAER